jgi:orotidine-5'-phosphate decarboxylase
MMETSAGPRTTTPILALDAGSARRAIELAESVPSAIFVKVGLQLFTSAGPDVVRALTALGRRVFLDLKLHDIPNTVAHAVRAAAALDVEMLTLHASGGRAMLDAARTAASNGHPGPRLMAVTLLTSLSAADAADAFGRESLDTADEAARLAAIAADAGLDGVVASVHEIGAIRHGITGDLLVLTPGIRLAGDDAGDQNRVATPRQAARGGADFIVVGRSVTAAPDPAAAFETVLRELAP